MPPDPGRSPNRAAGPARRSLRAFVVLVLTAAALVVTTSASTRARAAQPSDPGPASLPSAVPSAWTPQIDDGRVFGIAEVGSNIVVGGSFTSVSGVAHQRVVEFNENNGALVSSFAPAVNGNVNAVVPGPSANTVYLGGAFTQVNGKPAQFIALLNLSNGSIVSTFHPPAFNYGFVDDLVLRGNKLYVAGVFTAVGGVTHQGLAALDATSGALDPSLAVQLTGHHNDTGSGAQAAVGATDIDVTRDGRTMVVIGNFKYADGQLRNQVALVDLSGSTAVLSTWSTTRYAPYCYSWAFDQYVRGVAFSPDGSFFAINATGGGNAGTLCDSTSRFDTTSTPNSQPTWIDQTGGDTLWGITVTNVAVYVGGHNRWENNPYGVDNARAGAVPYPGMAALDVATGRPYSWNPGHIPLGVSPEAFLATAAGVWMGYDETYIGNRRYKRERIAFFPYAGGYTPASTSVNQLAGTVFLGGNPDNGSSSLTAVAFDGTHATASPAGNQGIDFTNWRGAFQVGHSVYYGYSDNMLYSRSFDGTTLGPAVKVDPYHNPTWSDVVPYSGSPSLRGVAPNWYNQLTSVTGMAYYKGRVYYTLSNDSHLYSKWFLPDSGVIDETTVTQTSSVSFAQADGMFVSGGNLYYGSRSDGSLRRLPFNGGNPTGSPTVVSGPGIDGVNWTNRAMFLGTGTSQNTAPTAAFTAGCTGLSCSFDGRSSSDPDGSVASYAWNFGDGTTGSGATPQHAFGSAGTYTVTLTVKDDGGAASAPVSHSVTVSAQPSGGVAFVAATHAAGGNTRTKQVPVPNAAHAGDTAVLMLAQTSTASWSGPSGITGWAPVGTAPAGRLTTTLWTKQLTAGDLGGTVRFDSTGYTHAAASMAVYSGVSATQPVSAVAHSAATGGTSFVTPTATAGAGDFPVSLWADQASSPVTWSAQSGLVIRDASDDSGTTLTVQSLIADANASSTGGTVGGVEGRTSAAAAAVATWTLVLHSA